MKALKLGGEAKWIASLATEGVSDNSEAIKGKENKVMKL